MTQLTDIDAISLTVRDNESKRLIIEAITAYRGGALRSAIMSTWIAVAYDIISKIRELARLEDPAANKFINELDNAIKNSEKRQLGQIEANLLETAYKELQILAPHEHDALIRLKKDRDLCAHPAFIIEDGLYQPTMELVRLHIVHALQHLLIHAPLQGKSAIKRFETDMLSSSFPTDSKAIGIYIRDKYLDRAKDILVINMIKAILSSTFSHERSNYVGREHILSMVLKEISKAKTAIYDNTVPGYVKQKFDAVSDDLLLGIAIYIKNDNRIWQWISDSVKLRIQKLLDSSDVEILKAQAAFDLLDVSETARILLLRFNTFDYATQVSTISEYPRREFVRQAIKLYSEAFNFREAERLGQSIIIPLAKFFKGQDIKNLLDGVTENDQINYAHGTPKILEKVFDLITPYHHESMPYWKTFVDNMAQKMNGNTEEYYAYPNIRKKLGA